MPIQTVYFIAPSTPEELVALSLYLNSSLANAFIKLVAWRARGGYFRHTSVAMGSLPIPMKINRLADLVGAHKTALHNFETWIKWLRDFDSDNRALIEDKVRDLIGLTSQEALALLNYSSWMNP